MYRRNAGSAMIGLILLLLFPPFPIARAEDGETYQEILQRGLVALRECRYEEGLEDFQKAGRLHPGWKGGRKTPTEHSKQPE